MTHKIPVVPARVNSVDALRGLIMIVMALDHVRDFHHRGAMSFRPDDLQRTTTAIFMTRWITHFCAPVFMFTAGLAAFYWLSRGQTGHQLSSRLVKRGLWLILLDQLVLPLAIFFSFTKGPVILNVLWALGWSMIALALLARLPFRILAPLSVATILLHNLLDPLQAKSFGSMSWLWNVIHQQGAFRVGSAVVVAAYPLIPWVGVMAAGFCFGRIMLFDPARQRLWTLRIGLAMTVSFLVLRSLNMYGDPVPWTTPLSFLKCSKYPPSLDFLLMTLGPALILLSWFSRLRFQPRNPLIVFGRTPLFFFIGHLFLAHLLAIPLAFFRYGRADFLWQPMPSMGGSFQIYPPDWGLELPAVYAIWLVVVLAMYPLCLWFRHQKDVRQPLPLASAPVGV